MVLSNTVDREGGNNDMNQEHGIQQFRQETSVDRLDEQARLVVRENTISGEHSVS